MFYAPETPPSAHYPIKNILVYALYYQSKRFRHSLLKVEAIDNITKCYFFIPCFFLTAVLTLNANTDERKSPLNLALFSVD